MFLLWLLVLIGIPIVLRLRARGEQQAGEDRGKEGVAGGAHSGSRHHGLASVTVSVSGGVDWPVAVCGGTR